MKVGDLVAIVLIKVYLKFQAKIFNGTLLLF
jgi:hypothetical protein